MDTAPTLPSPAALEPPCLLLIETQSPWQSGDSADFIRMAEALAESGALVHLHLIQNGVLWLQQDAQALDELQRRQPKRLLLSFDDLSLDLRGIPHSKASLHGQVHAIDALVSEMADRTVKTIWHS